MRRNHDVRHRSRVNLLEAWFLSQHDKRSALKRKELKTRQVSLVKSQQIAEICDKFNPLTGQPKHFESEPGSHDPEI